MEDYTEPRTQREAILEMYHDLKDVKREIYGNGTKRGLIARLTAIEDSCSSNGIGQKEDRRGKWIVRISLISMSIILLTDRLPALFQWLSNIFP